jgi:hypothetical protein
MAAAAALGLRLGNGGAKDADLERKGEAAAAVGVRKRRLEQLGCGGLRPRKEVDAPVGMVGLRGAGTGVWLGSGGRPRPAACLLACEVRFSLYHHDEGFSFFVCVSGTHDSLKKRNKKSSAAGSI